MTAALVALAATAFDPAQATIAGFLADLRRDDPAVAHARVADWQQAALAHKTAFAQHWERLKRWYGPLGEVTPLPTHGLAGSLLAFPGHGYVAGGRLSPDGKLTNFHINPYPEGTCNLLWAGHGARVVRADPARAAEGVVTFAVPPPYREQVPVWLTVAADPPEALKGHTLKRRADSLNWLLECTVNPGSKGATVFWEAAVLARPGDGVAGEPADAWTRPTGCVQSDHPAIVRRAKELRAKGGDFAGAVAEWVSRNRGTGKPFVALDAATALGCGGSCTSRANLTAALLRAEGVPARTVAHLPSWAGYHYVHWLTEYWQPGHGWRWVDPSVGRGAVTSAAGRLVVLNVSHPADEDETDWPNRRSGVMRGAPRLSSRELDGPIRPAGGLDRDVRGWGLCVPLANLDAATAAERADLWAAARAAHPRLRVNAAGAEALTRAAQRGGAAGLTAALRGG